MHGGVTRGGAMGRTAAAVLRLSEHLGDAIWCEVAGEPLTLFEPALKLGCEHANVRAAV